MAPTLDQVLYRLLHERAYRQLLVEGRLEELGLPPEQLAHLRVVDTRELTAMSDLICRYLMRGELEREGGLRSAYPQIFQLLETLEPDGTLRTMYRFVESSAYAAYRQIPYGGLGLCVEEAFFEFLQQDALFLGKGPELLLLLTHEFLSAVLKLLALHPSPAFEVRTERIRTNGRARYAIESYPEPFLAALRGATPEPGAASTGFYLYACTHERFVRGPIPRSFRDVVEAGSRARALELGASEAVVERASQMGLIA